jgi:hypothetical protein
VTVRRRDPRLEAWRAFPSRGELDQAYTLPFVVATMTIQSGRLSGAVRADRMRNVSQRWLVVTGIAADGGRAT